MEYNDLIKDFALRTRANLEYIKEQHNKTKVFEVTQLINSMLGLLILPQQLTKSIPETSLKELENKKWPMLQMLDSFPPALNLRELMRYLRNGVSHGHIHFISNPAKEISGVEIWNINNKGKITWKAKLTIEELEAITVNFISLILK